MHLDPLAARSLVCQIAGVIQKGHKVDHGEHFDSLLLLSSESSTIERFDPSHPENHNLILSGNTRYCSNCTVIKLMGIFKDLNVNINESLTKTCCLCAGCSYKRKIMLTKSGYWKLNLIKCISIKRIHAPSIEEFIKKRKRLYEYSQIEFTVDDLISLKIYLPNIARNIKLFIGGGI